MEDVGEDEACLGIYEGSFQTPDGSAFHRYQVVYVRREVPGDINPRLHAHVTDMGLNILFPYPALRVVGDGEGDTVGELRDIAERMRADYRPELPDVDPQEWAQDSVERLERARKRVLQQTTFGPGSVPSLEQRST